MGEMVVMQGTGSSRQLTTDMVHPGGIAQARIAMPGHHRQVAGILQLTRDQRAAQEGPGATLQAVGNDFRGGNSPLGEILEVLPLGLDPWPADEAPQALARAPVALDVIAHAVPLDANDLG